MTAIARALRYVGPVLFWASFAWSTCLMLSMMSVLIPFDKLPPWIGSWENMGIQSRIRHIDTILHMNSYQQVLLHFFRDATSLFVAYGYHLALFLLVGIFGPDIGGELL